AEILDRERVPALVGHRCDGFQPTVERLGIARGSVRRSELAVTIGLGSRVGHSGDTSYREATHRRTPAAPVCYLGRARLRHVGDSRRGSDERSLFSGPPNRHHVAHPATAAHNRRPTMQAKRTTAATGPTRTSRPMFGTHTTKADGSSASLVAAARPSSWPNDLPKDASDNNAATTRVSAMPRMHRDIRMQIRAPLGKIGEHTS